MDGQLRIGGFLIRPATSEDAVAYTDCHLDCLDQTYAQIMPPAFIEQYRDRRGELVADNADVISQAEQERLADRVPFREHLLAEDADHRVTGVFSFGPGRKPWDLELDCPPPPVEMNLDHIYTLAQTHGSGLGQAMIDVGLPRSTPAWLWILRGNPRTQAFYACNGSVADGVEVECGETWFHRPMFRMWRGTGQPS